MSQLHQLVSGQRQEAKHQVIHHLGIAITGRISGCENQRPSSHDFALYTFTKCRKPWASFTVFIYRIIAVIDLTMLTGYITDRSVITLFG